jgi:hypothetical protein
VWVSVAARRRLTPNAFGFFLQTEGNLSRVNDILVVYDLFREFSVSEHKRCSLFGGLACGHQIPDHLTAALTLKHADIALLPSDFLMKALQQVRGANPRDEGAWQVDL